MARRPPSWDASGLVEKAWQRLDPPTRDQLAKLLKLKAATNLSKLNTGDLPMTLDYAERIAAVVPGLSVADLGAPTSVVVAADPTVHDRLQELATAVELLTLKLDASVDLIADRLQDLEQRVARQASAAQATSTRKRRTG